MYFTPEGQEENDRKRAYELASHFAEAMLEGRLEAFQKQISRAEAAERRQAQRDENDEQAIDGFRDAIFAVARIADRPEHVTVSAVIDHLKRVIEMNNKHWISNSMLTPRSTRSYLKKLGFSWLEDGRKAGRPKKRSNHPA